MNMALDVNGNALVMPAPICKRARVELQPPARRRKASQDFIINSHAYESSSFRVRVWTRNGNDVSRSRLRRFRIDSAEAVNPRIFQLFFGHDLFVNRSGLLFHLERAVASHEF